MSTEIRRLLEDWRNQALEFDQQHKASLRGKSAMAVAAELSRAHADELEALLASPPGQEAPKGLFDRLESEITQLHNTCGHYEREIANLRAALLPSGLPPVDAQGQDVKR